MVTTKTSSKTSQTPGLHPKATTLSPSAQAMWKHRGGSRQLTGKWRILGQKSRSRSWGAFEMPLQDPTQHKAAPRLGTRQQAK